MNKIIIIPKIYVAFEDKATDQILVQDFDKELSLERRAHYLKNSGGSLLIEYDTQTFFIDKEDIFYLLCVTFPTMYLDVCSVKPILHTLQEREGYAIHMDPTAKENFIILNEVYWLRTPLPPYEITQSIILPMEAFLSQLLSVLTDFAHHYYRIKKNQVIPQYQWDLIEKAKLAFDDWRNRLYCC